MLVYPVNAFYLLGRSGEVKGSITGKGMHFSELCLFLLFSFSKSIKTASYKQHYSYCSHFHRAFPHPLSLNARSALHCSEENCLGITPPPLFHPQIYLWALFLNRHTFKNNSIMDWSAAPVTQTTVCSCQCFFVAGGPLFESCSLSPDCNRWWTELYHRAQNNKGRKIWTVSKRSPGKRHK